MPTRPNLGVALEFALSASPRLVAAIGDARQILGSDEADLVAGRPSFVGRIHPDDSDIADRLFSAQAEDASGTVCLRVRHADGRIRCLQAGFRRAGTRLHLHLEDAKSLSMRASREDIPDTCRAILDNASETMLFKDRNHVFTAVTAAFRAAASNILGDREVVGLTDYDFLSEAHADLFYAAEKQVLSGGPESGEVRDIVHLNPSTWIDVRNYPVKSSAGEIVGLYAVADNLTRRLSAEEQVYKANQALPESQKMAPIGSYVLDVRRGDHATSASLDAMLGLPEDHARDIAGWEAVIHPDDRQTTADYSHQVLATPGRIFNREYRIVRPSDGETRWIHGIGRVERDAQGSPLIMSGSLQDITERKATEAAVRETKHRLEFFIEHAPAALAMFDRNMCYLAVSRRWREVYGVSRDIVGRSHYEVFPALPERLREMHRLALAGQSFGRSEDQIVRPDGLTIWTRWELNPWRDDDGSIGGLFLYVEDITDRIVAQQRLKLAASVFAGASEAIFVADLNRNIIEVNDAFTRLTGYSRGEAVGQPLELLRSDRHDDNFYEGLSQSIREHGRWRGEQWFGCKDGTSVEAACTLTATYDTAGKPIHYVSLFFDLTPMREQERKLALVKNYDELTGLPNRAVTMERLRDAVAAADQGQKTVGIVFLDLDDFKRINDAHGREVGNSVLVTIASRMKQVLHDGDFLGRISGDEFLVVLPNLSGIEAATSAVERLLLAVNQPFAVNGGEVLPSITAGVSFYPQTEAVDSDQMVRQALQAMYEAKLAGKNRYFLFDAVRDSNTREHHEEIGRLRQALHANEFVLHYQPKVDMSTGALIGTEALIRWQHPQRGLLLPGRFLPAIEGDDLAIEAGEWVVKSALRQIEHWAAQGHRIPVSVNICPHHLQQGNFIERLRTLVDDAAVDPSCLELEILETSTVQDFEHVSRIIEACRVMGIKVSIDDFGTGYSSLSYLKKLPAPVIKIDQSFVRNMIEDPDDLALMQGIMGLASAFRRTVVAEGVETVEQGVLLLKLGCAYAQGYGIARPMPADEIVRWYSNWNPDTRWTQLEQTSRKDLPLLIAQVQGRAWERSLERYVAGLDSAPPELDEHVCRFGAWIAAEKAGSNAGSPQLSQIEALHRRSHAAAREAVALKEGGFIDEALSMTRSVVALCSQINARVAALAISVTEPFAEPSPTSRAMSLPAA